MAGRRIPLKPEQVLARDEVAQAYARLRTARQVAKAEAARVEAEMIANVEIEFNQAIVRAIDSGISRMRLANEALGHTNAARVSRSLDEAGYGGKTVDAVKVDAGTTFRRIDDTRVSVRLIGYPTTSHAPDYPSMLEGIVEQTPRGWVAVEDSSDMPGIKGHLHWELEHRPEVGEHTLAMQLTEWAEKN